MDNELDIYVRFLIDHAAQSGTIAGIDLIEKQFKEFQNQIKAAKQEAAELRTIAERIGQASRGLLVGGTALAGGIFAVASKYVKDAKEATEVTERWKKAQEDLASSGNRVGAVVAEQALPLLEEAARLAEKAAGFIEDNPEIVKAALNTGLVVAGLGAVGVAVSKGIRFYADYLYLAAIAKEAQGIAIFDAAVNKFLAGTSTFSGASKVGAGAAGAGAVGTGLLTTIGTLLAGLVSGSLIGDAIGDAIAKKIDPNASNYGFNDYVTVAKQAFAIDAALLVKLVAGQDKANETFLKVANFLGLRSNGQQPADSEKVTGVQASPAFEQVLRAYEKYKADDLKLVQDHYKERDQIVQDALSAEIESNKRYAQQVAEVNRQRSSSLAQAAQDFRLSEEKAEADYNNRRAEIVRDAGEEIARIEENLRERLRKLSVDHSDRMDELVRSRDALGLVKEQRAYNRQRAEEISQANREIRERRQDIARRLDDLQRSYQEERAQRLLEYQQRVKEINAQASERIASLRSQHQSELEEIRRNKADRLREIDQQFSEERRRRYNQFIQQVRDLDASLLNEKKLRDQYYQQMIADLDKFLAQYKEKMGGAIQSTTLTGRADGGYASYGAYILGDRPGGGRGPAEYVLSGNTTSIAERSLGSLTQDKILQALALASGMRNAFNYTDQRRMDSRISPTEREAIRRDTEMTVKRVLANALS